MRRFTVVKYAEHTGQNATCEQGFTLRDVLVLTDFEYNEIESILGLSTGDFCKIGNMFILRTDESP